MRAIGLVLAALAFSLTWSTADAARRQDGATGRASVSRSVASHGAPGRGQAARSATGRQGSALRASSSSRSPVLGRSGGRQAAAASSCSRSARGARRCTGPVRVAWQSGLAPAAHVQTADCPEGTMATNALGHANITRCMPI